MRPRDSRTLKPEIKQGRKLSCFSLYKVKPAGIGGERLKALPVFAYNTVCSTNSVAKNLIADGKIQSEAVVTALQQSGGRGRYDRSFLSKRKKGVYLSYVCPLPKNFSIGRISCFSSLAVCDMLALYTCFSDKISVKWPNDVLLGGKKICGILPENVLINGRRWLVLGIGVNINYTENDLGELRNKATSIRIFTGHKYSICDCTRTLIMTVSDTVKRTLFGEKAGDLYAVGEGAPLKEAYQGLCDTVGKYIYFGESLSRKGLAIGIDEDCALVIDENGKTTSLGWGEVFEQI